MTEPEEEWVPPEDEPAPEALAAAFPPASPEDRPPAPVAPLEVPVEAEHAGPAHEEETERLVLTGLLHAEQGRYFEEVRQALARLLPDHFYIDAYRHAFLSISALHEAGTLTTRDFRLDLEKRMPPSLCGDLVKRLVDDDTWCDLTREVEHLRDVAHRREAGRAAAGLLDASKNGVPLAVALAGHTLAVEGLSLRLGPASSPFECFTAPELLRAEIETPEPVIGGGLLRHGGVLVLQGEEKLGKSLLALCMALDLTRGYGEFLQFPIERAARVLYFSAEGGSSLTQDRLRKIAGRDEPVHEGLAFRFPKALGLDVNAPEGLSLLEAEIRRTSAEYVVLDPLAEVAPTLDENDTVAFKVFLAGLRRVLQRTGCGLVLVHHTAKMGITSRKGSARRGRGSTVLPAFADSIVTLEPGDGGIREATFSLRAGLDPGVMMLRLNGESLRFSVEATKDAPAPVGIDRVVAVVNGAGPEGVTYEEIANSLGVSERAVRDTLNKSGKAFKLTRTPAKGRTPTRWKKAEA